MKKRFLSLGLAVALTFSMSFTAFAAESSTTTANSSQGVTVEKATAGQEVKAESVKVAVVADNGAVTAVALPEVVDNVTDTLVTASATPETAVATVESVLTTPATEFFTKTVAAISEMKGSAMVVNNMGTIKTAATATDAFGNVIASAGVVEPVTGAVLGAFKGVPTVITVLVLA